MSVDLVATKTVRYAGRVFRSGQPFTVRSTSDATVLCAVGLARRGTFAPASVAESSPDHRPRRGRASKKDLTPAPDPDRDPEPDISYSHHYQRRDLTAEGE